jgi:dTMP kinase
MSAAAAATVRGDFITIEGPDGGGMTTQAERLARHLGADRLVHVTREPGGTWLGERVRELLLAGTDPAGPTDPITDALLFNAARRQLVREVIRPALGSGTTVVCARFADSTVAYQGHGAGVSLSTLAALESAATDGLRPDLTILLDLPVEVGLARKAPADVTRFESEYDLDFHRRVRAGFLSIAAADPDRVAVIDARPDTDSVAAAIAAEVDRRLSRREPSGDAVRIPG